MLSMTRYHDNSPPKEQIILDHSSNHIHAADAQHFLPSFHIDSLGSRIGLNSHSVREAASQASDSNFLGFDCPNNEDSSYQSSSYSSNPPNPLYGSLPLGTRITPTHSYSSNHSPSTILPSETTSVSSQNFPCYSSPAASARDLTGGTSNSPPSTSDISCDPASLYPSERQIHLDQQPKHLRPNIGPQVAPHSSPETPPTDQDVAQAKLGPNGLAEDQPPTAQGKMRTRVYVACLQCRSRKIRCDGAKPKCQKCARKATDCDYDPAPKRRGPDKKPGARQRTSKKAKTARDDTKSDVEPDAAVRREFVGKNTTSSFVGTYRDDYTRNPHPSCRILDPLQNLEPYDIDAHRGSISSSVELPLPVTPVDDPEIRLSLPPAPNITESPNMSFGPERVDVSDRFSRLLPESPFTSNSLSLDVSIASSYGTAPRFKYQSRNFHGEDYEFPHYNQIVSSSDERGTEYYGEDEIGSEPSLDYSRKTWWDSLVAVYLPASDRITSARQLLTDLRFLFKTSNYFFSFINAPLFFSLFCNPVERDKMQPSLVLSILAVSAFMTSSEIDQGTNGRMRSLWLRDAAQSSLEASLNAQWIDPTLAQAAWLLALFEMCAHPLHSSERVNSSMVLLDSIIRMLRLTSIDEHDPRVSRFDSRNVPVVHVPVPSRVASRQGCCCASLTLGHNSPISHQHTPLWVATAAWNPDWTVAEIRKEESRRLCWSSLQIAAGHTAHAAAFSTPPLNYYCIQPSNYSLLFPGESLLQSPSFAISHSPKESIWALYSRTMLLWNSCLRMRESHAGHAEKANFAVNAWIETTVLEDAFNAHTCGCDQAFLFQGREFLFITRMCISYEFRRFIPHPETDFNGLFNRKKAEEWLVKQASIAKRVMQGLHTVTGHKNNVLARRPFFIWWFMGQVARCLLLWQLDNSLIIALEVCEAFFAPIDYLSCLWPCPTQRGRYLEMHERLSRACQAAGLPSPPKPNFDLFAPGSPPVPVV